MDRDDAYGTFPNVLMTCDGDSQMPDSRTRQDMENRLRTAAPLETTV